MADLPENGQSAPVADSPTAAAAAATEPEATAPAAADSSENASAAAVSATVAATDEVRKWPGWPGDNVFRLVVPVIKVGSIIGRKGELIKRLVDETRARVRILEGPMGSTERIVLISGREEPEAEIPPAMDALLRVFKRVNGIVEAGPDGTAPTSAAPAVCSVRLVVAASQAINLIGKQGASIKAIQESSGATIRVLSIDERERPFYATEDERIIEIQGETMKVVKALQAVSGHLRKFLVDHSVLPLFEKSCNTSITQDRTGDAWSDKTQSYVSSAQQPVVGNEYGLPVKRDSMFLDHELPVDHHISRSGVSLYGRDPALSSLRSSGIGHGAGPLVTQITQTMQVPLAYAEDIIGVKGANIAYIRANSGAVVTVQESLGSPDDITVEIKGTASQVQAAQQLVQDAMVGRRDTVRSSYGVDSGYRSSYSQYAGSAYPSSSLSSYSGLGGGYGSSGLGGYGSYRY